MYIGIFGANGVGSDLQGPPDPKASILGSIDIFNQSNKYSPIPAGYRYYL